MFKELFSLIFSANYDKYKNDPLFMYEADKILTNDKKNKNNVDELDEDYILNILDDLDFDEDEGDYDD